MIDVRTSRFALLANDQSMSWESPKAKTWPTTWYCRKGLKIPTNYQLPNGWAMTAIATWRGTKSTKPTLSHLWPNRQVAVVLFGDHMVIPSEEFHLNALARNLKYSRQLCLKYSRQLCRPQKWWIFRVTPLPNSKPQEWQEPNFKSNKMWYKMIQNYTVQNVDALHVIFTWKL